MLRQREPRGPQESERVPIIGVLLYWRGAGWYAIASGKNTAGDEVLILRPMALSREQAADPDQVRAQLFRQKLGWGAALVQGETLDDFRVQQLI